MALNFNVLAQVPSIAERFMAGEQAAREEQQRNMLLQQRQMEFQQAQAERLAVAEERRLKAQRQAEEDEWLGKMASLFEQNNQPLTLENAQKGLSFAVRSRNAPAIQMMQKTVEALRGRAAREELLGGIAAPAGAPPVAPALAVEPVAAPAAAATPAMEAAPAMAVEPTLDERGVNRAAWMAKAGLEEAVAPAPVANVLAAPPAPAVNVLAAAPAVQVAGPTEMPTAAAPSAAVQEQIASLRAQQRRALAAGEKDIAAYFGSQITSLEAQTDPTKRYKVVGNQMFDFLTQQFVTPPALPARAGAPAPAAGAREARTKAPPADVAAMQQLGYPLTPEGYAQFKAAGRKPAAAPAAAPGAPAAGTPAQQAKAEAQQAAQTKLSQDLQTQLGYYEELAKMGAMSSPGRPVVANVIAYARSSGLGQEAERAAGTKAQTLRDNIANARQRILMHVKNATGATAGQMNSNIELQTWLRSLTDPQQSIETVRETLKQMDAVIGSVRNQVAQEGTRRAPAAAPAAAPAPAPAPAAANRREIAPGVFVTERP